VPIATGVAAQPGGHQASVVAVISMIFLFGALAFTPLIYALIVRRGAQRALRLCPLCADSAVRTAHCDIDGLSAHVQLQCGQCGAWRRVTVPADQLDRHAQRIERDRREIETWAQRLENDRARAGIEVPR
jgi:ribosomal protein S27AE